MRKAQPEFNGELTGVGVLDAALEDDTVSVHGAGLAGSVARGRCALGVEADRGQAGKGDLAVAVGHSGSVIPHAERGVTGVFDEEDAATVGAVSGDSAVGGIVGGAGDDRNAHQMFTPEMVRVTAPETVWTAD